MPNMKVTIEALKAAGLRDKVKVMVGGAPLTDQYAREIGADGYSSDASRAVALAKSLVG
jgi:5-methyltetrahydrofolate--homocysteine methyltransferase